MTTETKTPETPETDALWGRLMKACHKLGVHPKDGNEVFASLDAFRALEHRNAELAKRVGELERERDRNHEMWVHWQTEATKLGGELFETNRAARTYENAFNLALQQSDAANEALKRARVAIEGILGEAGFEGLPESKQEALRAALAAAETDK